MEPALFKFHQITLTANRWN